MRYIIIDSSSCSQFYIVACVYMFQIDDCMPVLIVDSYIHFLVCNTHVGTSCFMTMHAFDMYTGLLINTV